MEANDARKNPSRRRIVLRGLLLIVLAICGAGLWAYLEIWIPNQTLSRLDWVKTAPPEEVRKVCHKVISHRFGNHHDAFILLNRAGNEESIPCLIRSLAWQQGPNERGNMVCTTGHCLDSLRALTGESSLTTYGAWKQWWDEAGSKMPKEEIRRLVAASMEKAERERASARKRNSSNL